MPLDTYACFHRRMTATGGWSVDDGARRSGSIAVDQEDLGQMKVAAT